MASAILADQEERRKRKEERSAEEAKERAWMESLSESERSAIKKDRHRSNMLIATLAGVVAGSLMRGGSQ
ncbi:hypothetical protein ACUTR7_00405 [Delftia sp. NA_296.1]|uniref:hypothetical protein n=1 Tax=Delftia sp. NA_296.1 TaxID=3415648 RepID=UPI0040465299